MKLHNFIARRYLFAKKSHNVINIISMISAAGIAIGCAALVIILSIYNGFDSIVRDLNNSYTADVQILPKEGKTFSITEFDEALGNALKADTTNVAAVCGILEESVFVQYGQYNKVVVARGVDSLYENVTGLRDHIVDGEFELKYGQLNEVVLGRTIALELGLKVAFLQPLIAYFPSRTKTVDMLDPLSSLRQVRLSPSGIVSLEQGFDQKYMFMPIDALRNLLEYEDEVSSVEIYLNPAALNSKDIVSNDFQKKIEESAAGYIVRNKQQQNEMLYKLLMYEKIAIYLILLFVMLIISFNIFGSLSMLIIDKKDDIETLRAMGADDKLIKRIFASEGWLISLCGIIGGVLLGLLVCWLQQRFGIVKMPGNFVITAYPVVVKWTDVALIIAGVALIGYFISVLTRGRTR